MNNRRAITVAAVLAFALASAGAFLPRNNWTFLSIDGEFTRGSTIQLTHFADAFPALPVASFEGMGTIFQFNSLLSLSLLPLGLFPEPLAVWLCYIACAGLMFGSAYYLARSLDADRAVALVAAWMLPLLTLPYHGPFVSYPIYGIQTMGADSVSISMLGLALLVRGYTGPHLYRCALGVFLVVIWNFLADPLWLLIILPTVAAVAVGVLATNLRRPDFFRKTAWLLLPTVLFVILGGGPYFYGLFTDTAAFFFRREMIINVTHSWAAVSVIGTGKLGLAWVGFGLVGLVLAIRSEGQPLRVAALSVLGSIGVLAIYGVIYLLSSTWPYPYPIYFEFAVWPFYTLFAAYFIVTVARHAAPVGLLLHPRITAWAIACARTPWGIAGSLLIAGAALGVAFAVHPARIEPDAIVRQPVATKITEAMRPSATVAPGAPFGGYVATLTGFGGADSPGTDWLAVLPENNSALIAFGNSERMPSFWRFGLATLEEYSEMTEPAFYAVVTRLLDRPDDRQIRNVTIVTRANLPVLQSLGVRYLVTDYALPPPARLAAQESAAGVTHFLFELPDPNLGTSSPTEIAAARNATEILQVIANPKFDFQKSVVLDRRIDDALRPADDASLTVVRGGWRVRADSAATSLLLLPIQFSNCLAVREDQAQSGHVIAVLRANLVETALVFQGKIDATLKLRVSPFWRPYCRIRDAHEVRDLGIADVPLKLGSASDGGGAQP